MEIKGKLFKVLEAQTGQGRNGEWRKQDFIIELEGSYPRKVCFTGWGAKVDVEALKGQEGSLFDVSFDIESREFNGKWYTNLTAFKVEIEGAQLQQILPQQEPQIPEVEVFQPDLNEATEKDDLPF